ncbi:hypothetical protein AX14_001828 [Amanita brunnescens Koide BX004]|nr:hypothetical protein AX14_001828 [Amanita brunnescens Koide BX004]
MHMAELIPTTAAAAVLEIACSGAAFRAAWELDLFSRYPTEAIFVADITLVGAVVVIVAPPSAAHPAPSCKRVANSNWRNVP